MFVYIFFVPQYAVRKQCLLGSIIRERGYLVDYVFNSDFPLLACQVTDTNTNSAINFHCILLRLNNCVFNSQQSETLWYSYLILNCLQLTVRRERNIDVSTSSQLMSFVSCINNLRYKIRSTLRSAYANDHKFLELTAILGNRQRLLKWHWIEPAASTVAKLTAVCV